MNLLCKIILLSFILSTIFIDVTAQQLTEVINQENVRIITAAQQTNVYLPFLKNKRVGLVANQTSMIGDTHLVDSLLKLGVKVKKVFSPEHGFRGNADAGEHLKNYKDAKTGIPVIALYGKNYKPLASDLKGLDIILFDIQDVGVRFYTYISTMHYVMEACAENKIQLMILDRPNPNGHYVDGPVLEKEYKSFVGMHPIPVVHGLTIGELAGMINAEGWLSNGIKCDLTIIPCDRYSHQDLYSLPVKPSPNLPNMKAVYLYPSLCFFEGTVISVGRGTDKPFEVFGHPDLKTGNFSFVPRSIQGASKNPPYLGISCYGYELSQFADLYIKTYKKLYLFWLLQTYKDFPTKDEFFNDFFNKLAGNGKLMQQIKDGKTEEEIRNSWEPQLSNFREMRKKYLLYQDYEN